MEKLCTDVLDIIQRIANLGLVLELQAIMGDLNRLNSKMEAWDAQIASLNKFHLQILHNSTLTLSLLRERTADMEDKQEANELYKFLSSEWNSVIDATRARKASL